MGGDRHTALGLAFSDGTSAVPRRAPNDAEAARAYVPPRTVFGTRSGQPRSPCAETVVSDTETVWRSFGEA